MSECPFLLIVSSFFFHFGDSPLFNRSTFSCSLPFYFYLYFILKYEKFFFFLVVLFSAAIIIWPQYYITGDGASHTYNARVLFDFVLGRNRDFYDDFFYINRNLDPNWMSHLVLGALQQFMPAWLADKSFQLLYLFVFAYGLRFLIHAINPDSGFLAFLFYPFVFNLPFQQGFYNYCFALALLFWSLGFFIRFRDKLQNPMFALGQSLLLLACTFSHGMPAIYTMMMMGSILLYDLFPLLRQYSWKLVLIDVARMALIFLPSAMIILLFLAKRGSGIEPHAWSKWKKWLEFLKMWTSQSTRSTEMYPAIAALLLIVVSVIWLLIHFRKVQGNSKKWVFLFVAMALFFLISYIQCPHSIGGAGSIDIRLAFLPPLFLLIACAALLWPFKWRLIFMSLCLGITLSFQFIRFPYVLKANQIGQEIMKAKNYIKPYSVVLNIHMDDWQKLNDHDSLFHRDGSFIHFSDFLACEPNLPLILIMNYEAEINYFPVNWQHGKNPRESIASLMPGTYPPCGDPMPYEQQSEQKIDYVLIQNPRNYFSCDSILQGQLSRHFKSVYKNKFVELYQRL